MFSAFERVSSFKNLKQNLTKPVLNSLSNEKGSQGPFKTFYKKQLLVKNKLLPEDQTSQHSKVSSLNITTDDIEEARLRMRLSEHYQEAELDKLEVTFKKKKTQLQKQKPEKPVSDKGILIHSLSDLFKAVENMEPTK